MESSSLKIQKYIAFSISAGCYFYQLGIAYYLQQNFNLDNIKFSGASGGSWPAVLLAANEDIKKAFEYVITYGTECAQNRPILGAYMVYDQGVATVFKKLWENIHLPTLVKGKLAISVTRLAWDTIPYLKDEIVTEFYSNQDIYECVIASALIPFAINGKPYVIYRNWICADGGITNVTGVRHFAEELVHDIELIEEEIVEHAQQFTDDIMVTLQDEFLSEDSAENIQNRPPRTSLTQVQLPFTTGPEGIVKFGVTVSRTIIDIITDSLERLLESRKKSVLHHSTNSNTEHLLYYPSPLLLSTMEKNGSHLLHGVLSDVHPSCQQILDRLHDASIRLHNQSSPDLQAELDHPSTRKRSSKTSSYLLSACESLCSTILGKTPLFDDSSYTIQEIFSDEPYWLGNHSSSFSSFPLLQNDKQDEVSTSMTPFGALHSENDENSQQLSDAPVCISQANSFQHLECKDYQEEDEGEENRIHSVSTNFDEDMIEVPSSPPQPVSSPADFCKLHVEYSSSSARSIYSGELPIDAYKTPPDLPELQMTEKISFDIAPGVGSVDFVHCPSAPSSTATSTMKPTTTPRNSGQYWKKQGDIIKKIPNGGGIQLEISPWMWRHHSIWNYHLSADPMDAIKLFNMGINDAYHHHEELKKFFDI